MKIKTITCHDVYNYGASLQAYALQEFLKKCGCEVQIIDYLPDAYGTRYETFKFKCKSGKVFRICKVLPFLKPLFALWWHRKDIPFLGRAKRFRNFKREYLNCTRTYHSFRELNESPIDADMFIAGSDQIWNTQYLNGKDPAFYCDFIKGNQVCISYAASFGINNIKEGYEDFVKKQLSKFYAISVREKTGEKIIESLGLKAVTVLDPVLLLTKEEWNSLLNKEFKGNYLLLYDFQMDNPLVKKMVIEIAKTRHLKIYSVNDWRQCPYADRNINNAGPIEFLELISEAQFVISTSFHATVFSVIFEKQFITFPLLGHNNSSRMKDFLSEFGLSNRFVENEPYNISDIDYTIINKLLSLRQAKSRNWLIHTISGYNH